MCPNKCSAPQGQCDLKSKCECKPGFSGADCGQIEQDGYWEALNSVKHQRIFGRALHQATVIDSRMYVVGGEFFQKEEANDQFVIYFDFNESKWNLIDNRQASAINLKRFSSSLASYNQSLFMYGGLLENGTISNELWRYDIKQNHWNLVEANFKQDQCTYDYCAPLSVTGHTANVIDDRMIVIFGYNGKFGFLNTVQEFNFNTKAWSLVKTNGALVRGGFGHSSTYFGETKTIYVFGGQHSFVTDSTVVDFLYAYQVYQNKWRLLTASKSPRYELLSAAF